MIVYIVYNDDQIIGVYANDEFAEDIANEWNAKCTSARVQDLEGDSDD